MPSSISALIIFIISIIFLIVYFHGQTIIKKNEQYYAKKIQDIINEDKPAIKKIDELRSLYKEIHKKDNTSLAFQDSALNIILKWAHKEGFSYITEDVLKYN